MAAREAIAAHAAAFAMHVERTLARPDRATEPRVCVSEGGDELSANLERLTLGGAAAGAPRAEAPPLRLLAPVPRFKKRAEGVDGRDALAAPVVPSVGDMVPGGVARADAPPPPTHAADARHVHRRHAWRQGHVQRAFPGSTGASAPPKGAGASCHAHRTAATAAAAFAAAPGAGGARRAEVVVVVDTSVWVDTAERLCAWARAEGLCIGVPFAVVRELDGLKLSPGARGTAARAAIGAINTHVRPAQPTAGSDSAADGGGSGLRPLRVRLQAFHEVYHTVTTSAPPVNADEQILDFCLWLRDIAGACPVLASADGALRVKARANGLPHGLEGVREAQAQLRAGARAEVHGGASTASPPRAAEARRAHADPAAGHAHVSAGGRAQAHGAQPSPGDARCASIVGCGDAAGAEAGGEEDEESLRAQLLVKEAEVASLRARLERAVRRREACVGAPAPAEAAAASAGPSARGQAAAAAEGRVASAAGEISIGPPAAAASRGSSSPAHSPASALTSATVNAAAAPAAQSPPSSASGSAGQRVGVELLSASAEALQRLPGVGPALAARIVEHRARTPFRCVDDLSSVKGVGAQLLAALRPLVRVAPTATAPPGGRHVAAAPAPAPGEEPARTLVDERSTPVAVRTPVTPDAGEAPAGLSPLESERRQLE